MVVYEVKKKMRKKEITADCIVPLISTPDLTPAVICMQRVSDNSNP